MKRILFAAGGTGGHLSPALTVARALRVLCPDWEIHFVGVGKEIEKRLVTDFPLHELPALPFLGGGLAGKFRLLASLPAAILRGRRFINRMKPDLVIAFGGYPSFLPILCAPGIPRILHEQNIQAGVANRFLARFVDLVIGQPGVKGLPGQVLELPLPVKEEGYRVEPWERPEQGITLLIIGGSQGARSLSNGVIEIAKSLVTSFPQLRIIHQSGAADYERVQSEYQRIGVPAEVQPFFVDLPSKLSEAHLVISRAGAMSCAELGVAGRPTVFVPLAIAAGHQAENARPYVEGGGAVMVLHGDEFSERLERVVQSLLGDLARLEQMAGRMRAIAGAGERPAELIAKKIHSFVIDSNSETTSAQSV